VVPVLADSGWKREDLDELEASVSRDHLETVLRWVAAGIEVFGLVRGIRTASRAISDIVDRVRSYSSLDRGPVQRVDLRESLDNALSILRGQVGPGVTVDMLVDAETPCIEAHGGELGQVWTNLIQNALDAMGEEGTLEIRARGTEGGITVEISDTGPGIPEALRTRIFDPFFTTKPQGKGTGLGLAISYGIVVNQHRGAIRLASRPGRTTFQVDLPLRLPGPGS
jgi:signal transduction histidine kinase